MLDDKKEEIFNVQFREKLVEDKMGKCLEFRWRQAKAINIFNA